MSEIKLLPCPFCGGEAYLDTFEYHSRAYEAVFCDDCGIRGEGYACGCVDSKKLAIKAWNTREPMERIVEQLDRASDYYDCEEQGREHVQMVDLTDAIEIVKAGGVHE